MLKKSLLLMALAGLTLSGCADLNCCDSSIIEVFPSSVTLEHTTGNSAPVDVTSSVVWKVMNKPDWVTLPMDGPAGLITLTVTGTTNSTGAARTGKVTFMAANGDKATLTVMQDRNYTVTFIANAGGATVLSFPLSQIKTHDLPLSLSGGGATPPTRTGFAFVGWNTAANGSSTYYAAGAMYTANADITLYAQWSGDGNSTVNPYLIWLPGQLETLATEVNGGDNKNGKYYKIINDLNMSGSNPLGDGLGFVPIGNNTNQFRGNLDGNTHTVSHLHINRSGDDYIGLFGYISGGKVQNLNITNADITGREKVGSIAGGINGTSGALGIIDNCHVSGNINGTDNTVGGVVGSIGAYGNVSGCLVDGIVSGVSYVGGVVGHISGAGSKLINCGVKAEVKSNSSSGIQIGGIAGEINANGYVANCYATGNISGATQIGGVVGYVYGGTITNCYATGNVTGNSRVGGVAGGSFGTVTYCYATGVISGVSNIGGVLGLIVVQTASPFQAGVLKNCVALNSAVKVSTSGIGRMVGYITGGTTVDDNWAWADMMATGIQSFTGTFGGNDINGEPVTNVNAKNVTWWTVPGGPGWAFGTTDAAPWVWNSTLTRPVLYWE